MNLQIGLLGAIGYIGFKAIYLLVSKAFNVKTITHNISLLGCSLLFFLVMFSNQ